MEMDGWRWMKEDAAPDRLIVRSVVEVPPPQARGPQRMHVLTRRCVWSRFLACAES